MRKLLLSLLLLVVSALGAAVGLTPAASAASTGNSAPQSGKIVSETPSATTPNILDGTVYSIAQVGDLIVVGGTFTQVRNANSSTVLPRTNLFAFSATTGKVSTTFVPNPNGTAVNKVLAAADGSSVYVGGAGITTVSGSPVKNLFELSTGTGALVPSFLPAKPNAAVADLELVGPRLWVGGKFTTLGSTARVGLGTLNASTGAYDPYFSGVLAGTHNTTAGSVTSVTAISSDPANGQLVAVGNFTSVDGASRPQIAKLDVSGSGGATLSPWYTTLYTSPCSAKFPTTMTDVEYATDGSYFIVSTTAGYGGYAPSMAGNSGCDVVARFESNGTTLSKATWTAYTGGDTTWTVEVTDDVIYAGGHQRWQNNPTAGDAYGQGAVTRTGIAALDPVNGMPYSWNPTRTRGVGVQDMLATSNGLYVGSDTNTIGGQTHYRMALLPLSGGKSLPSITPDTLPTDVYTVASGGSALARRTFNGSAVTSSGPGANGMDWSTSVGAFMVNGVLYSATSNGVLTKRTFDGTTYGPASTVDAADTLIAQTDWHATDVPYLTSLFYWQGRIYFTRSNSTSLFARGFETESDVVGQQRPTVLGPSGVSASSIRGAFVAGDNLYDSTTGGSLFRVDWSSKGASGTPVLVSGPTTDGQSWASRAMFVSQGTPNASPTASAAVSCTGLTCSFDGSASGDPDGSVASYTWDFGDDSTDTGATTTHTYAGAGSYPVTLTVTDNRGGTATTTRTASPTAAANAIGYVDSASASSTSTRPVTVTIPSTVQAGDTLLAFFSANAPTLTYTGPSGWTDVQSQTSSYLAGRAWTRTATDADAAGTVSVTSSSTAKSNLTVLVYRGVDTSAPVTGSATSLDNTSTATHTTPTVTAGDGSSWLVSYWSDKSSATTGWTGPAGQSQRATTIGTGTGYVTSLVDDSDGPVASGTQGGRSATTDAAAKGLSMSVLLKSS